MSKLEAYYDLVIVGGAGAGAVLAASLRDTSYSVLVLESRPVDKFSPQIIALNQASCLLLQDICPAIPLSSAVAIDNVHVSYEGAFGVRRYTAADFHVPHLGRMIAMRTIEEAAQAQCEVLPNVTWCQPATYEKLTYQAPYWTLTVSGQSISTKLLIGADGAHSSVAHALGIGREVRPYEHVALISRVTWQKHHNYGAWERFCRHSTFAVLPWRNNETVVVWSIDKQRAEALCANKTHLQEEMPKALGYRLGVVQALHDTFVLPLRHQTPVTTVAKQSLLIGNAAHTFHPVAAQGFNLTLRDIAYCQKQMRQGSLFDAAGLAHYAQQREVEGHRLGQATQLLARGITERAWPGILAAIGMQVVRPWQSQIGYLALGAVDDAA